MGLQGCCKALLEAFLFLVLERGVLPRRSRRNTKIKKIKKYFLLRNKGFISLRVLRGERMCELRGSKEKRGVLPRRPRRSRKA